YLGGEAPDDCWFCGAPKNFIRDSEEFFPLWKTKLSSQEKKDMQETLNLEINASAYYKNVENRCEKYSKYNRLFKQLSRVEKEHVEIAIKFLDVKFPELIGEKTKGSCKKDLERTRELEEGAIKMYKRFLKNSTNSNVKNFYIALIHAEKGHFDISCEELKK
ncbi:hypothetical protein GOV12_00565, partial [Candidatus Pacearchaeota archaeon]|nr:hypothetical protein [Candidatus Pacearchaeota archaeon]